MVTIIIFLNEMNFLSIDLYLPTKGMGVGVGVGGGGGGRYYPTRQSKPDAW